MLCLTCLLVCGLDSVWMWWRTFLLWFCGFGFPVLCSFVIWCLICSVLCLWVWIVHSINSVVLISGVCFWILFCGSKLFVVYCDWCSVLLMFVFGCAYCWKLALGWCCLFRYCFVILFDLDLLVLVAKLVVWLGLFLAWLFCFALWVGIDVLFGCFYLVYCWFLLVWFGICLSGFVVYCRFDGFGDCFRAMVVFELRILGLV